MTASSSTPEPIYDSLVEELGDIPAQTRQTAEKVLVEAAQALQWGTPASGDE
ncbi:MULTISPECIES: hypothetical protein [Streptomyces]|uniref:hypothetical protein n=1 Tax=Streptomyces TaxID=1883 RepID=UPI0022AE5E9A|nr:hypothetical protein [Streptomyces sp. H39-C1]MCZ4103686.1 hypothetical protein [Streptomyces sp. H39-C1]